MLLARTVAANPRSKRALTTARRSPCFATVVGTWNSELLIVDVIVPLDRSGLSVTRTSVFAKFSTTPHVASG